MDLWSGLEHVVREQEPLAAFTSLRLGGPAQFLAEPTTLDELSALVKRAREYDLPVRLLGGGSNLLVRDHGVAGLVIHLAAAPFAEITVKGRTLTAGGGAKLGHVVSTAVREGLAGLEPLAGIPGTLGGALHGNTSSAGGDAGQWARGATVMTRAGDILTRHREDLRFAYRESSLDELVILSATFELESENPGELTKRMQKQWIVKKAAQPLSNQNCAYLFKDPVGSSAASLIEEAKLKGTRIGDAEVCDRYANFVVAGPKATTDDVLRLVDLIRSHVHDRLGVELETSLEVW
jgi:UDP-N-acetylmuramate dehydrogenase